MQTYTPSLDWSTEAVTSLLWVARAWAITVVCLLIALTLLARFTVWGRQFWRVTGDYFKGRQSLPAWGLLALMVLSVMASTRISVLLSYQSNDQFSAIEAALNRDNAQMHASGVTGFWVAILTLLVLIVLFVTQQLLDIYLTQRFIIRWRVWLTERLTGNWLSGRAYYKGRFIDAPIDNPDQRIQQDIDAFTTGVSAQTNNPMVGTTQTLLFGSVNSIAVVVSFAPILWKLSGPVTFFGVTLPKALFWMVLLYVLLATIAAFWIGKPLIRLSFRNERTNAAFRYSLVRLRDSAEAVAFYRGEDDEGVTLRDRFHAVIANYRAFLRRTLILFGWNMSLSQLINPLPTVAQIGRVFDGKITLGDMTQSSSAFLAVHDSLSFFRSVYDSFASYRATIVRVHGLVEANEKARELPTLTALPAADSRVRLEDVEVRTPAGRQLIQPVTMRLEPGDSLVIVGESGSGKTTLLRSLAQLWPFTTGTLSCPDGPGDTMFLSQLPYLPLGDLRTVVSYPATGGYDDDRVRRVLHQVALGHLADRLDEEEDWAKVLSPGEQQRVAFARVLLQRPKVLFLDEATASLDEGHELALYELLRSELPDCIVVSVSHRSSVDRHHGRQLQLLGDGLWRLTER